MHPHRFRLTLGAQLPAVVLEVANQFLLLCVKRKGEQGSPRIADSITASNAAGRSG